MGVRKDTLEGQLQKIDMNLSADTRYFRMSFPQSIDVTFSKGKKRSESDEKKCGWTLT